MRYWFLSGLLVLLISTIITWITGKIEILVYFNEIIGILSLAIAFYIFIGMKFYYRINNIISNHDHAEYNRKSLLKYKFILFGIPNLIVGEIINRVYGIWN